MATIQTSSLCLAEIHKGPAMAEAAKVAQFFQAEQSAQSGTGETDLFRYTFRRVGECRAELRIFPQTREGGYEFSGEAYASW